MSRRRPREPTRERLLRRALYHLQRYATPRAHMERLLRRALAEARALGLDPVEVRDRVGAVMDELDRMGLFDDRAFAEAKVRRWLARGVPPARIAVRLHERGVDPEVVAAVLAGSAEGREAAEAEAAADAEVAAARAYVARRRLGPYRPPEERARMRERDLAALARAGFSCAAARAALEEEGDGERREGGGRP
ncbi:Regulatory protein RecX [bacterium HR39]|nr:Regulatory protein RecX [bacterium HR39]